MKQFDDKEQYFIKNVIRIADEKPTSIIKRTSDSHIVLEFPSTKYLISSTGYVDEVWICEDGGWLSLGTEKDAY